MESHIHNEIETAMRLLTIKAAVVQESEEIVINLENWEKPMDVVGLNRSLKYSFGQ